MSLFFRVVKARKVAEEARDEAEASLGRDSCCASQAVQVAWASSWSACSPEKCRA